jgi:hypothetical protein
MAPTTFVSPIEIEMLSNIDAAGAQLFQQLRGLFSSFVLDSTEGWAIDDNTMN